MPPRSRKKKSQRTTTQRAAAAATPSPGRRTRRVVSTSSRVEEVDAEEPDADGPVAEQAGEVEVQPSPEGYTPTEIIEEDPGLMAEIEGESLAALAAPAGEEVAPIPAEPLDLSSVIPVDRPRGFINCLRDAMGLHDYPDVYHGIISDISTIATSLRLDSEVTWPRQNQTKLVQIYQLTRERHPYMRRFINDWAIQEYLRRHMKYQRSYRRGKAAKKDDKDKGQGGAPST